MERIQNSRIVRSIDNIAADYYYRLCRICNQWTNRRWPIAVILFVTCRLHSVVSVSFIALCVRSVLILQWLTGFSRLQTTVHDQRAAVSQLCSGRWASWVGKLINRVYPTKQRCGHCWNEHKGCPKRLGCYRTRVLTSHAVFNHIQMSTSLFLRVQQMSFLFYDDN